MKLKNIITKYGILFQRVITKLLFVFICSIYTLQASPHPDDFKVVVQTDHTARINSILYSTTTKQVISASNDNFIRVWSGTAGQEFGRLVHILYGHTDNVTAVSIQPEGRKLISGGKDGKLILWDLLSGKKDDQLIVGEKIVAITYSDDPTQNSIAVALEGEKSIRFFDATKNLVEVKQLQLHSKGDVSFMLSFNSWRYIACATTSGELAIIDITTNATPKLISLTSSKILTLGKLNDETLIWIDELGKVGTFNITTATPSKETWPLVSSSEKVSTASFNPENNIITLETTQGKLKWADALSRRGNAKDGINATSSLSIENGIIVVGNRLGRLSWLNKSTMDEIPTPNATSSIERAVAVSSNTIATLNQDYNLWVWNLSNGAATLYPLPDKSGAQYHLSYNDKGDRLLIGKGTANSSLLMLFQDSIYAFGTNLSAVEALSFIPGTDNFISSHSNGSLIMWDAKTRQQITSLKLSQPQLGISVIKDDCITIEKGIIRIWNVLTMKQKDSIRIQAGILTSCAVHPTNHKIAVGYKDGSISIFKKTEKGGYSETKITVHRDKVNRLAWMENNLFSSSRDNSLRQLSEDLITVNESYDHASEVQDFALFPNNEFVASVGNDGTCIVSSLKSFEPVMKLVSVAPDGWVAVSNDGLFDASTTGISYMNIVSQNRSMPLENYISILEKPGILAEVVGRASKTPVKNRNDIAKLLENIPPSITILSPLTVKSIKKNEINVTVELHTGTSGIEELRITNNGTIDTTIPQKELHGLMTIPVTLVSGKNFIRVEGASATGIRGFDTVSIFNEIQSESKPTLYVLAIGISKYKNSKYTLKYARNDAESVCSAIKENLSTSEYKDVQIYPIFDEKATYRTITETFDEIAGKIKPTDRFIFYYAGHGSLAVKNSEEEFYLVTQDVESIADRQIIEEKGISVHTIQTKFGLVRCEKKAIILDACHAGSVTASFDEQSGASKVLYQLNRNAGVYLMSSALLSQQARENDKLQHGLFTVALLEGLSGRAASNYDAQVSLFTLQDYIGKRIKKIMNDNNIQNQTPIFRSFDSEGFVVTQKKN